MKWQKKKNRIANCSEIAIFACKQKMSIPLNGSSQRVVKMPIADAPSEEKPNDTAKMAQPTRQNRSQPGRPMDVYFERCAMSGGNRSADSGKTRQFFVQKNAHQLGIHYLYRWSPHLRVCNLRKVDWTLCERKMRFSSHFGRLVRAIRASIAFDPEKQDLPPAQANYARNPVVSLFRLFFFFFSIFRIFKMFMDPPQKPQRPQRHKNYFKYLLPECVCVRVCFLLLSIAWFIWPDRFVRISRIVGLETQIHSHNAKFHIWNHVFTVKYSTGYLTCRYLDFTQTTM